MVPFTDLLVRYGVPSLGVLMSDAIFASSFPVVRRARILRNIEGLDAVTLTVQFVGAQAWLQYASIVNDPFIWTSNTIGAILTTFYIATILELAVANGKLATRGKVEVIYAVGMLSLTILTTLINFVFESHDVKVAVVGYAANTLSILMSVAPALNMYRAFKEKSAVCIQIPLNVASFICNITWSVYGLIVKNDPFIYVACMICVILAAAQLVTVLIFLKPDMAKRRMMAQNEKLQKMKAAAIQQHYEQQKGSTYLPLEFDSEYLAERLALRNETGHPPLVEQHETAATALMGVSIEHHMTGAVLRDLAKDSSQLAVLVRPPTDDKDNSGSPQKQTVAHNALQSIMESLQQVSHVQCTPLACGEGNENSMYAMSLAPKGDDSATLLDHMPRRQSTSLNVNNDPTSPCPVLDLQLRNCGRFTFSCRSMPDLELLTNRCDNAQSV